jgi:hypothetical protein
MGGSTTAMNMPGMSMGQPGGHATVNLLPEWLGIAGLVLFGLIALSHLRHLATTNGQRAPWHACHVLMAIGMCFMYAPAAIHLPAVPSSFWQVAFALTGTLAAIWALGGSDRAPNLIWLLTAIDLFAMVYMWSPSALVAPLTWVLVAYLVAEAGLWALDAYRRIDGNPPISGLTIATAGHQPGGVTVGAAPAMLLGDLDISASMIGMTLGMAYMLVAMQLMS